MSYKYNCNCGKSDCTCHHHHSGHNHFVDISCMETQPYDDSQTLLGMNNCGKVISVEKPEPELSALDRKKLDKIEVDGSGSSALYDDGNYKETYTKEEIDSELDSSLEDAVFYNGENNIEARADLIIGRNNELRAKNSDGTEYTLIQATTIGISNYGDNGKLTNLVSSTRPVAQLSGESITEVHPLAFVEDVNEVSDDLTGFKADTINNFADINERVENHSSDTASNFETVNDRVDSLASDTASGFEEVNDRMDSLEAEVGSLETTTAAYLQNVNNALDNLDDRVTANANNITINADDISTLRDDLNAQDKFKGYYLTNAQIQIIPGETGAYAWSAESRTVWVYNSNSWVDSGDIIPDQTVEAYTGKPLMDGRAHAGSSNEYSRGDHRHPTDTTRAAATDLDNYLPLTGNSQATSMSGDIWLGSGNALRTSDSGNSYIIHNSDLQQTQIITSGIGGVNIQTPGSTAKYNGTEIATVNNITSVSGEVSNLANTVNAIDSRVFQNESDIAGLQNYVESAEHFKGYFAKTSEITSSSGESGAFAWNGQTGTVWTYNPSVPSWVDSEAAIPSETPYNALPQMDGTASAGNSNEYSRGNHVHPTDASRASAYDLSELEKIVSLQDNRLSAAEGNISSLETLVSGNSTDITLLQSASSDQGTWVSKLETNVYDLQGRTSATEGTISTLQNIVSSNSSDIQSLVGDVSSNSTAIDALQSGVSYCKKSISTIDSRVSTNESDIAGNSSDIESILIELANQEKFRGYYETTVEITALIGSAGNYAWNGETNSVWLYDGNTWADSGAAIPTGAGVSASDLTPLVDGEAKPGESNEYARGDHRHPTDLSRASAGDLTALTGTVTDIDSTVEDISDELDKVNQDVSELKSIIVTDESGDLFLANDGTYKPVQSEGKLVISRAYNNGQTIVPFPDDVPEEITILSVNYNRLMLFEDDYRYQDGILEVINSEIIADFDSNDRIEVIYTA